MRKAYYLILTVPKWKEDYIITKGNRIQHHYDDVSADYLTIIMARRRQERIAYIDTRESAKALGIRLLNEHYTDGIDKDCYMAVKEVWLI